MAQSQVEPVLTTAQQMIGSGQFAEAYTLLDTWQDTHALSDSDTYQYWLLKCMSAMEGREGKKARHAYGRLQQQIPLLPEQTRKQPELQLTLAYISFKLDDGSAGCVIMDSIAVENIPHDDRQCVFYLFLQGRCREKEEQETALTLYREALELSKKMINRDWQLEAMIKGTLGNIFRSRDPVVAVHFFLQQAAALDSVYAPNHLDVAGAHYNAANLYYELTEYSNALAEYQQAYPGFAHHFKQGDRYMRFITEAMGDMYWELGNRDSAVYYYDLSIIGEASVNHDKGDPLHALGDSLLRSGKSEDALQYYRSALAFRKEQFGERHPLTGACNNFIARVYERHGLIPAAMQIYQRSLIGFTHDFDDTSGYANPTLSQFHTGSEQYAIEALRAKSNGFLEIYERTCDPRDLQAAGEAIELCMQLIEKGRTLPITEDTRMFWSEVARPVYESALRTELMKYRLTNDPAHLDRAFAVNEKSKAYTLLQVLRNDSSQYRDVPLPILEKEQALKKAMTDYSGKVLREQKRCDEQRDKKLAGWNDQLEKVQGEYTSFIDQIRHAYPAYYAYRYGMDVIPLRDLRQSLDDTTALLSIVESRQSLTVFMISHASVFAEEYHIDSSYRINLQALIRTLRMPGTDPQPEAIQWQAHCRNLFTTYLSAALASATHCSKLIVIHDGMLSYIPFELIVSGQSSSSGVLGQMAISYAPSATLFAMAAVQPDQPRISFTGIAPVYQDVAVGHTREHRQLKYNVAEIHEIGALFKRSVLYTGLKTKEQFLGAIESPGILHLAMHAMIDEQEPMLSSFSLGAGESEDVRVHAYEIQSRSMRAQHAVLSACNTGIGKLRHGEGMMSLARCFQYAGCPSLLVSLWPVDDLATQQLMTYYYKHLLAGLPKDVSLQKAKQDFLGTADPSTRHPFYWSGFILIGNADPIDVSSRNPMVWIVVFICVAAATLLVALIRCSASKKSARTIS
jgi:CHAT domain-containing protein